MREKTQYIHLRLRKPRSGYAYSPASTTGGVTIGYFFDSDSDCIHVGVAVCGLETRYVKKEGRDKVDQRLKIADSGKLATEVLNESGTLQYKRIPISELSEEALRLLENSVSYYVRDSRSVLPKDIAYKDLSGAFVNVFVTNSVLSDLRIVQNRDFL